MGSGVCDAEIKCLSRVLALLPVNHVPVTLQGCSATLFNAFSIWCKGEGSPEPLFVTEYTPEVFKGHVHDAGLVGASSLDPFAVLEYLMLRLAKAIHQPWLMGLLQFRRCIRRREVPFASLCAVLEELVEHWADIKLFLEESVTGPVPKGKAPLDMSRVVVTDSFVLPRLSLLHVLVACFQANFEKQFVNVVSDYSCRNYAEFCFFYWSLLSKVKKLSELPEVEAWSQYVGRPLNTWSNVPALECLRSEPIVMSALGGCGDTVKRSFLKECHSFLMEFLKVLNSCAFAKSRVLSSLSCFSPDMLLQGDEAYTVELFRDLVNCFQDCGRLSVSEGEGSCNEFKSLLVELRRRSRQAVASINNGLYFLRSSGLLDCRPNLSNVIRVAELVLVPRSVEYPDVDMSMSGVKIPERILTTSVVSVQSFVSCGGFSAGELLTKDCLEELKVDLPNGRAFVEDASFAPWRPLYSRVRSELYSGLRSAFDTYYLEQVNEWRRKSGLGMSSSHPTPDKSQPTVESRVVAAVANVSGTPVESLGHGSSPPAPVVPNALSCLSFSPSRSSDVTRILQAEREARSSGSPVQVAPKSKGSSSRKRGSKS